ncbi:hypothetical protein NEOC65_002332 [Neochlamydia sp. AcF65]|uniref:tetratricopeptide repeat protein n=1 Tax=Neochlamydia sp. AcF65 TaxID=2795735 RepID=UPI001BC9EECC|nr:tetratricopeptide repeat protein [Neochlamydia sp. AcF65]MBS4167226.1 hypothetical protein [Neochlamydia sp. AcF65]
MNIESIHRHHFIFPVFRKIEEELAYPTGYPDIYRKIGLKIFKELKEQDLCQLRAVCKEWKLLIQETSLGKKLYQKSFSVRLEGKNQEIKANHKNDVFNPFIFLASLPSKTLKSMLCSGNDLNDRELKDIFDAQYETQIFKNSQFDNIKFLQLYPIHQLPAYLQKLNNYLEQITSSIDCANYHLPKGEINELEEFYTLALKLAIYEKDFVQESFCIEKLGDIYVEKGTAETFLQAVGLYNYVLHDFSSAKRHEIIRSKLSKVEILLIKLCTEKLLNLDVRQAYFVENRKLLKVFRNQIEKKMQTFPEDPSFEEVRELYREITQGVKSFFSILVNQSEEALGASPCEYAMIGFGSLAREEMTPYSDLEFGILVQENTPTTRKYFKSLTFLLHLKVINLGETILPALNIPCLKAISFFDGRTPRGFCFDGEGVKGKGCKTPFGNRHTFELINTPEKMAQYIAKNEEGGWWHDQEPHLPMELLTFTHLLGNPELTRRYSQKVQERLDTPYQEKFTLRQHLAKHHLIQQDMKNFEPGVETLEKQGMLFKAKNDFYRFPHLAIDRLALLLKMASSDTFARIDQLNQQEILTGEAAKKLKEWMSIALFMRLKTYTYYQAQNDSMNPLIKPFGFDEPEIVQKCLALDHKTLEKIKKIYGIFIPFHKAIQEFLAGNEEILKTSVLNNNALQTQGLIALRLLQYEEAKKYYELAIQASSGDVEAWNTLATIYYAQGNLEKAIEINTRALNTALKQNKKNLYHIARSYNNLGMIYLNQGKLKKAEECANQALSIGYSMVGENHPLIAIRYNNLGNIFESQGNLKLAIKCVKKALEIDLRITGMDYPHLAIRYNNLARMYNTNGKLTQAIYCVEQALALDLKLFGENHPKMAIRYGNLGTICEAQGDLEQAAEYMNRALVIDLKFFGKIHPRIASHYSNLGTIYFSQRKLEKALEYARQALDVDLKLYGKDYHKVAIRYNNLAQIYQLQGRLRKAARYTRKALHISLNCFGKKHFQLAIFYKNLGIIYQCQSKLEQATDCMKQALHLNLEHYGENHFSIAMDYEHLQKIYQAQGDLKQAAKYAKKILKFHIKASGKDHEHARQAVYYNNLASIYHNQGKLEKAIACGKQSLKTNLKLHGKKHLLSAVDYENLGQLYQMQGNLEQAIKYINKALKINQDLLDKNHPSIARLYNKFTSILKTIDEPTQYAMKALESPLKVYGNHSLIIKVFYHNIKEFISNFH